MSYNMFTYLEHKKSWIGEVIHGYDIFKKEKRAQEWKLELTIHIQTKHWKLSSIFNLYFCYPKSETLWKSEFSIPLSISNLIICTIF